MIVSVKKYNARREVIDTELHYPNKIRLQPAGLIELFFSDRDTKYIRFYSSDKLDVTILDYIEEDTNGNQP